MNGIIFDIKRYAIHDGPGIRTTVFMKGCPLDCWWCHNPESRDPRPESSADLRFPKGCLLLHSDKDTIGKQVSVDQVIREIEKDILFYDESKGGVTFSGGEPLMQPAFLKELLSACRERDIHTAVDTSGYTPFLQFAAIAEEVNLFLFDIKLMDDRAHHKYTGVSNRQILENLVRLFRAGHKIQVRIPLIPNVTDSLENIEAIINFLKSEKIFVPVALLPYNRFAENKYDKLNKDQRLPALQVQENDWLDRLKETFSSAGFEIV